MTEATEAPHADVHGFRTMHDLMVDLTLAPAISGETA